MPDVVLLELEDVLLRTRDIRRAARASAGRLADANDPTAGALRALVEEREFLSDLSHGVELLPGAADFVERAIGRSRLAIVTRATRRETSAMLDLSELGDRFDVIITADDADPAPSPDGLRLACRRLAARGARIETVLVLASSHEGIRAAAAAGFPCIAVGEIPVHEAMDGAALVETLSSVDELWQLATRPE